MKDQLPNGVMFNAYPDSIGERLADVISLMKRPKFVDAFSLFYILPTFFNSDLDRGFSVIDYEMNLDLVSPEDLVELKKLNISLKFDLVLNHLSVESPQFQDLLSKGDNSAYKGFFIDWNKFWQGEGMINNEGIVEPNAGHLEKLFMRKPGLPILKVRFPDGTDRYYWNTFYQKVTSKGDQITYTGQMDLNAASEQVWSFYEDTIRKLASFGAKIVRLDAFAYLHKSVGHSNFFNRPGTWDYLDRLKQMIKEHDLVLLPEIHAEYGTGIHGELSDQGFPIYDFFFPGLVIHTLRTGSNKHLIKWIEEILDKGYKTVNMLGCHDGIPVIDLKGGIQNEKYSSGLLSDPDIESTIENILDGGGKIKNLYGPDGKKISYYQVNATFFSALGEDEASLRLARAIQLFMPGTPQIWYLDLFAGKNDYEAVERAGEGGHKEINRTNLSMSSIEEKLKTKIVLDQLEMIRFRNTSMAFQGKLTKESSSISQLKLFWTNDNEQAILNADLRTKAFTISSVIGETHNILEYNL